MFKSVKNSPTVDAADKYRQQRADEAKVSAEIEALAVTAETEALTKADALLAEAIAEHERDCGGYKFECRRWGDFLSLFIERQVIDWGFEPRPYLAKTYATSVNIRETRELKLIEGNGPDSNGNLEYHVALRGDDGSSGWGTGYGRAPAPNGYHYYVWPDYPTTKPTRRLFALDPRPEPNDRYGMVMDMNDYQPKHRTPNYPRAASDDQIRFEGIGATLFAPAGHGRAVYEKILREIGDYEKHKG